MSKLEITTVIGCKNMCVYCPQNKILSNYKDKNRIMSLDVFKKCIDKVSRNVLIIFVGMSEPFQNKECIDMIKYANEKGFIIKVFTTGVGMTKKDIDVLGKINLSSFEVHLPSNIADTKIKIDNHYLDIIKSIGKSNIKNKTYLVYGKIDKRVKDALGFDVEDSSRLIENRANNLGYAPVLKELKGSIICNGSGKMLNENILLPNGDVVLCCMDYSLKHKLGNLLESSYEDLFKADNFSKMQGALEEGDILCRYCNCARLTKSKKFSIKNKLKKTGVLNKIYFLSNIKLIKNIYIFIMNFKNRKNLKYKNIIKEKNE